MATHSPDRAAVLAAHAALPDSHRQVLDLARSGHSFEAIARQAGLPAVTVRRWVLHAVCSLSQARAAGAPSKLAGGA